MAWGNIFSAGLRPRALQRPEPLGGRLPKWWGSTQLLLTVTSNVIASCLSYSNTKDLQFCHFVNA